MNYSQQLKLFKDQFVKMDPASSPLVLSVVLAVADTLENNTEALDYILFFEKVYVDNIDIELRKVSTIFSTRFECSLASSPLVSSVVFRPSRISLLGNSTNRLPSSVKYMMTRTTKLHSKRVEKMRKIHSKRVRTSSSR